MKTVREAAAYWFVQQSAGEMTESSSRLFHEWLQASAAHHSAYEETAAAMKGFPSDIDPEELRAFRVAALGLAPERRVWPRAAAMAAGVLLVLGVGALLAWQLIGPRAAPVDVGPNADRYVTAHNQRSTVRLPDGTSVSLNLDSELRTEFSAARRVVRLSRGQAFFDVAKDAQRPFTVVAGDREILALGTKFDVRLDENKVQVVLVEGRVSVEQQDRSLVDLVARRPKHVELRPGEKLLALAGKQPDVSMTNAVGATSWHEGWVTFEDESVGDAVTELNRYSDRPIIVDADAQEMRISGVFRIGEPERFGAVMEELLPVQVVQRPDGSAELKRRE